MKKQFSDQLKALSRIVGEKNLLTREEQMLDYSHDEFPDTQISQVPLAVVKPVNTLQVIEILKWANKANVPVTARGGGTGLCGGCIPTAGGIVLWSPAVSPPHACAR